MEYADYQAARINWLREWGVPDDLLEYVDVPAPFFEMEEIEDLEPQLWLPDDWTPEHQPTLERVQHALTLGIGLLINDQEEFDFRWVEDALPFTTSLWCAPLAGGYRGVHLLSKATSLRYMLTPETDETVDLSYLPRLESVTITSPTLISAAAGPAVRRVTIKSGVDTTQLRLSPTVEYLQTSCANPDITGRLTNLGRLRSLTLTNAQTIDLSFLGATGSIEDLSLLTIKSVDLTPLPLLPRLNKLAIVEVGVVTGMIALPHCSALRSVAMFDIKSMDDPDVLLELKLDKFRGDKKSFTPGFIKLSRESGRDWQLD